MSCCTVELLQFNVIHYDGSELASRGRISDFRATGDLQCTGQKEWHCLVISILSCPNPVLSEVIAISTDWHECSVVGRWPQANAIWPFLEISMYTRVWERHWVGGCLFFITVGQLQLDKCHAWRGCAGFTGDHADLTENQQPALSLLPLSAYYSGLSIYLLGSAQLLPTNHMKALASYLLSTWIHKPNGIQEMTNGRERPGVKQRISEKVKH